MSAIELEQSPTAIVRAIHANVQKHQWQAALQLIQLQLSLKPDVICYGATMNACVRAAQWPAAHVGGSEHLEMYSACKSRSPAILNTAVDDCQLLGRFVQLNELPSVPSPLCTGRLSRCRSLWHAEVLLGLMPAVKPLGSGFRMSRHQGHEFEQEVDISFFPLVATPD